MQILVIDDNNDIVELLKTLLESVGYDVSTSNSGKESLDLIRKEEYEIVLLDITMPDFSGLDVIQSLKDSGDLEKNKIILFTAAAISDAEIKKWKEFGIKDCLRKPFDPALLFETITNVSMQ